MKLLTMQCVKGKRFNTYDHRGQGVSKVLESSHGVLIPRRFLETQLRRFIQFSGKDCDGPHETLDERVAPAHHATKYNQRRGTLCIQIKGRTHTLGFGCIDVSTPPASYEPRARINCSVHWSADACRGNLMSDVSTTDVLSFQTSAKSILSNGGNASLKRPRREPRYYSDETR